MSLCCLGQQLAYFWGLSSRCVSQSLHEALGGGVEMFLIRDLVKPDVSLPSCPSSGASMLPFETGSLTLLGLTDWARLAGQGTPGIFCPPSPGLHSSATVPSSLCDFTNPAISPAPFQSFTQEKETQEVTQHDAPETRWCDHRPSRLLAPDGHPAHYAFHLFQSGHLGHFL